MNNTLSRIAAGVFGGAALFALAGCNIIGPAVVLIHGPEKADAAYELDPKRNIVVFIDDRGNRLDKRSLRLTMAKSTTDLLLKDGGFKSIIDPKAPLTRVSGESAEEPTDIVTLGKSVGAEIVIYTTVDAFALASDGHTYQPTATLRVKVIDTAKEPARLWPDEPTGKVVSVAVPERQGSAPKSGAEYSKAQEKLAIECGEAVAKLFYKHQIQQRISEKNGRD